MHCETYYHRAMSAFEHVILFLYQSLALQTDVVRDALEKDPKERTSEDLDILLRFTQELEAFKPFTMGVTKAFCEGISMNCRCRRVYYYKNSFI